MEKRLLTSILYCGVTDSLLGCMLVEARISS